MAGPAKTPQHNSRTKAADQHTSNETKGMVHTPALLTKNMTAKTAGSAL
jgi:hypothetical protein